MRARLQWSDVQMLRAILVLLDTQGWRLLVPPGPTNPEEEGIAVPDDLAEVREAVELITSHFREPLEAKGVNLACIQDEVEEIVCFARKFLNISTEDYTKIWYKLHTSPDAGSKWPNILRICKLVFSLPFTNSHVERLFSTLKIIKTDRRTRLHTATLSDLLEIQVEGPPLASFSADQAVSLWWEDCKTTRRINQHPRKQYNPIESSTSTSESDTIMDTIVLEDWDKWFS